MRALLDPYSDIAGVPMWKMDESTPFYSHMRPVEAREEFERLGWSFEDYFRFTFVRNPWARLVSLYAMIYARRQGRLAELARRTARLLGTHPSPRGFRRWVRTISTDGAGGGGPADQRWQTYGTYTIRAYAGDENGIELVDRVVRLEDIDTALPPLLAEIGLPAEAGRDIPRVNVKGRADHRRWYDADTAGYVKDLYREDIERFGYEFGG